MSRRKPRPFAVADCETDPFLKGRMPEPFLWGFWDGSEYREFERTDEFIGFLSEYPGVVYAHNGGKFDWHFIKDYFDPGTAMMLINGRIAKAKLGECEIRDSWNILPVPLAAYQKDEIDYRIMEKSEREKPGNRQKIRDYLRGDCVYLYNLVSAFRERHGDALTQAGAAMKSWQRRYDTKAPQSSAEYYDKFRAFYYGGRVQCFERGVRKVPFKVYDINSAYPYAMLSPHPATLNFFTTTPKDLEAFVNEHPCSAVQLHCNSKGALPWREEVGKKIHYPNDTKVREYFVTGHELKVAFKHGAISKVRGVRAYYWAGLADFREFILPLYAERQEAKKVSNKEADILAKLEMNSLYGKFGSDPRRYKSFMLFEPNSISELLQGTLEEGSRQYEYAGEFGKLLLGQAPLHKAEERFYNVATALSITGYVRSMLYDAMQRCEGVLYCDTDSLAVTGQAGLDIGPELGQWESEGDFVQYAIAGRKLYAYQRPEPDPKTGELWKVRSKGVRLTHQEILKVAGGGEVKYAFEAPTFSAKKGAYFTSRKITAEKA